MWSLGRAGIFLHSPVLLCGHIGLDNEAQKQTRDFYIKFTFNSVIQCS